MGIRVAKQPHPRPIAPYNDLFIEADATLDLSKVCAIFVRLKSN